MNLKQYLAFLTFGTIITWFAFVVIIINIDPVTAGTLAIVVLYAILFFGLTGLIAGLATFVRAIKFPKQAVEKLMKISLRQGFILTILIEGALILSSQEKLTWWMLLLLIGLVVIVEFISLSLAKDS